MRAKTYRWVLDDLSNSDIKHYMWLFYSREEAREKLREHKANAHLARLGNMRRMSVKLLDSYEWIYAYYYYNPNAGWRVKR